MSATLPSRIRPMLAVPGEPFDSDDFWFEVKWDGFRSIVFLEGKTRLQSRNLQDLTPFFPELQGLHALARDQAVLDGEIVLPNRGRPDFQRLQARVRGGRDPVRAWAAARRWPVVYVAFDLLFADGRDLRPLPLEERRAALLEQISPGDNLIVSEAVAGAGVSLYQACLAQGLEGVVAKRRGSPYLSGRRSRYWIKIRAERAIDAVIGGYTLQAGGMRLKALLVGAYPPPPASSGPTPGGPLVYLGRVGTGWSARTAADLLHPLRSLSRPACPFRQVPPSEARDARWVEPRLVCTVRYLALTGEGRLRHPSFRGLRADKDPEECWLP